MLKILPIFPSSTSQQSTYYSYLFSCHYLLIPYYSFALKFQVCNDIQKNKKLICIGFIVNIRGIVPNFSNTSKRPMKVIHAFS